MVTPDRLDTRRPAVRMNASTRLRRWAARRARQLFRVSLVLTVGLVLGLSGVLIWREASLIGLPEIGDPFDVAAVSATKPGDEHDAFVFFRKATAKLRPWPAVPLTVDRAGPAVGWSKADPRLREWVEANREALELFRKAAEQPDGIAQPAAR